MKIIRGNEAFNEAMIREPPKPFTWTTNQLYAACSIGFFWAMNGYDGSLVNNLLYRGSNDGIWASIVAAMDLIGRVVSLPFIGPSADTYGRRFGMWVGYLMINVGTVVQGTAGPDHGAGQLMGDRSLLGLGVDITRATGPM
ncbi:hypothetical protein PZA11_006002 [Diplocarpon coronariae]